MKDIYNEQQVINDIVQRIDYLRVDLGVSIYELAKRADLSENTLKHIYKRHSFPNISTLYRLCRAFEIPLWQFFLFQDANINNINFSKKEIELLKNYEKLTLHSQELLFEVAKNLK